MAKGNQSMMPSIRASLSARLLVLTFLFVVLAEVLVFVPSIARYRQGFLDQRLDAAHIAGLALEATGNNFISEALEEELLDSARVQAIIVKRHDVRAIMMRGNSPPAVVARYDLTDPGAFGLIVDAFVTLWRGGGGSILAVTALPGGKPGETLEIILSEAPLWRGLVDFSGRILGLTIVISLVTAGLVYWALHRLLVNPMRAITRSMVAFRKSPEDVSVTLAASLRRDEIGTAQRELARMQDDLRAALKQKTHLAQLGAAVSRINHDLRNSLASAQLVSSRLGHSDDPAARRLTPMLVAALDRARDLCTRTLQFGRADEPPPRRIRFDLAPLVDDIAFATGLNGGDNIQWRSEISAGLEIDADPDQLHRVILNLSRNAARALRDAGKGGTIAISGTRRGGEVIIELADTGPGLSEGARAHLFEPFAGSTRSGGSGLGLAISRELARAHGGDIRLVRSDADGTVFRISIPDRG